MKIAWKPAGEPSVAQLSKTNNISSKLTRTMSLPKSRMGVWVPKTQRIQKQFTRCAGASAADSYCGFTQVLFFAPW